MGDADIIIEGEFIQLWIFFHLLEDILIGVL